jgi:hypothetical protein
MNDSIEKIDKLDVSLFETIHSQTSFEEKQSLLAVQRATARKHKEYVYLEIGSYLGGSIQPYIVDDRCKKIYSIDPRPVQQPDDRSPGAIVHYNKNTTERMLNMLDSLDYSDIEKMECFDLDASGVEPAKITSRAQIIFIDGQHTKSAVLSDFQFCSKVVSENGTILFHDFGYIYPAILEICNQLDKQHHTYLALKLEGSLFALFFDSDLVHTDPYLVSLQKKYQNFWFKFHLNNWLNKYLPYPLLKLIRKLWNVFRNKTAENE